jgi:uncharacterized membrane protein
MTVQDLTLVAAGFLASMTAGIFLAFVCAVNLGLGKLSDATYLTAMQSINEKIQNPVFGLTFMGPVLLYPLTAVLNGSAGGLRLALLIASGALYIFGTFGITAGGNVPLNNRLAQLDLARLSPATLREVRGWFEGPWQRLHVIRTLCAIVAVAATFVAATL